MTRNQLARMLGCDGPSAGDVTITSATEDSRRAVPGAVFFAVGGGQADGHAFADQAVRAGAIAVVGERPDLRTWAGVPYFRVSNPRKALGKLAHALVNNPSRAMTVIGITGTNGKTSSVLLARAVLNHCGRVAAGFGTLGYAIGESVLPAKHTTPFAEELADMFARARTAGVTHVVMEASSHALEQDRTAGIDFDVAAFTNLTQDHLDYHHDMQAYGRAKLKLFEQIEGANRFTVVNADDPEAETFVRASRVPCYTFGETGDYRARDLQLERGATRFTVDTPGGSAPVVLRLLGRHNVSNALCAIAIGVGLGLPVDAVAGGIEALMRVPGRFEHVEAGQDFQVVIDYAHTDDGLRNVLRAAREICGKRVIVVFGCGGDRDKTKRPKMAAAVAERGDFAILTSDNPRTEDPERILADIEAGMEHAGAKRDKDYWVIRDRAEAIRQAIGLAQTGDLVLIAGKGHEDYQIIGTERIHFDDREVALDVLADLET